MPILLVCLPVRRDAENGVRVRCQSCEARIRRNSGQAECAGWDQPCICDPLMAEPSFGRGLSIEELVWHKRREATKRLPDTPPADDGEPEW